MNINDIFGLFEKLGVTYIVNDNKATFYDAESGLQMEVWEDKTKELSLDNLQMGRYYTLVPESSNKMLRFQLTNPHIDGKIDKSQVIVKHTCYGSDDNFHIVDLVLDLVPETNVGFEVKTDYLDGDVIRVKSGNYIFFDINNKYGVYKNVFDESYDLSATEMSEALNSSEGIRIFSEYYGKIFPELLETVQSAKSLTEGTAKK